MYKSHQSFAELVRQGQCPYSSTLTPRVIASLDSRAFSLFVEQYASWVEDGLHLVIRQFFAAEPNVSRYLLLTYPPDLNAMEECGRRRERRTLLYRLRYFLRCLAKFAGEWQRFEGWQIAGLRMSLEVFCGLVHQSVPTGADLRLAELVERFVMLWSPVSKIGDAADMAAELSDLVDLAEEAFSDLQNAFVLREMAIRNRRREGEKAAADAASLAVIRQTLDGVSSATAETADAVRRIEKRQCRRAGVSAPVSLQAQDQCLRLWDESRDHPERLSVDVKGRKVSKADAFDYLIRRGRLPRTVTTLIAFTRAIDLAQKRRRAKS